MNKIFSKVWNKKLGQLVVASELARNKTNAVGVSHAPASPRLVLALAVAAALMSAVAGNAMAAGTCIDPVTGLPNGNATGPNSVACGQNANANSPDAIAIGTNSVADGGGAGGFNGSIAIGVDAQAISGRGLAMGVGAQASGLDATAIGWGAISDGEWSVAVGVNARATGRTATAFGYQAVADGRAATALGVGAEAHGSGGSAFGEDAMVTAVATDGTALGRRATVSGANGTAVGSLNTVSGVRSTAVGASNTVSGSGSGAFGSGDIVSGNGSYAVGNNNAIAQNNTFVLGNGVFTTQANSVVLGNNSRDRAATAQSGVVINGVSYSYAGVGSAANGVVSVGAVGGERQLINVAAGEVSATSTDAVNGSQLFATNTAIENLAIEVAGSATHYYSVNDGGVQGGNYANNGATGVNSMAGGVNAVSTGNSSVAMGHNSNATGASSVAVGAGSQSTVDGGVALGAGSVSNTAAGVAGYVPTGADATQTAAILATTSTAGAISVGDAGTGLYRQITGVAAGTAASDAVNVAQLQAVQNQVVASATHYYSVNDGGVQGGNYANDGATGLNSMAAGVNSTATGTNSVAVGTNSHATATNSAALGSGSQATHVNSVAVGNGSATTVGAQTNYNAAYVGNSTSTGEMNVGGRTITGVAPGIAGTDAVNVNQLTGGVNYAIDQSKAYTDARITNIEGDIWTMKRDFRGATSSAMAMAGLPQAYLPGKSMLAVGMGGYQGEYGMAIGLSGITENGRYVYKAAASGNTSRDWGFSVGAGIQW